jgi:hypothetical protein
MTINGTTSTATSGSPACTTWSPEWQGTDCLVCLATAAGAWTAWPADAAPGDIDQTHPQLVRDSRTSAVTARSYYHHYHETPSRSLRTGYNSRRIPQPLR